MKVTWLGQAGLMFETGGKTILVDPYLSNSVAKIEPHNQRRVPVQEKFLKVKPDVILLTHCHLDHTDPETLQHYLNEESSVLVLASYNAWQTVRKLGGLKNNYTMFDRKTRWTEGELVFEAVYAAHSDDHAVGIVMYAEGKTFYITGDTLYNELVFADLPERIDYVFLPVNGRGNNMNMADGKTFCQRIGAKAIPLHCGLFDDLDLNDFAYVNKIVPEFFKEIKL
ncbi:MAG: MBL fold metallo-hydrolase [Oscillospiraceae bacterium]|nr:MBL fold metallo-hydrolase [Oscillospiraceae bacterium]